MNRDIKIGLATICIIGLAACGPSSSDGHGSAKKNQSSDAPQRVSLNPEGVQFAKRIYADEIMNAVLGHDTLIALDQALASSGVDMMVSADTYANDYDANEIAADNKYKGKTILITGKVDSINKGVTGKGYLALRAKGAPLGMQAHLNSDGTEGAASLSKGSLVYLVCKSGPKIGPVSTTTNCQRFSQYLMGRAASIEKKVDRFFAGEIALPRTEAQSLIGGYVLGRRLQKDSPCMTNLEKCESELDELTSNKTISDEIRADSEKLTQLLKIE
jgi:hypothetical protein